MTSDKSASAVTTRCPNCGADSTGKFCSECGTSLVPDACAQCGATLAMGARFCNSCGTATVRARSAAPGEAAGGRRGGGQSGRGMTGTAAGGGASGAATYWPWAIATIALLAAVGYFASQNATVAEAPGGAPGGAPDGANVAAGAPDPSAAPFANGGGGGGGNGGGAPPDISRMTPRERATRLYDRIMRYAVEGKKDSAQFFAPMALASFDALGAELDLNARYEFGRVATETGNFPIAFAQADTILKQSPNHLLGLALSARASGAQGNSDAAAKVWKEFLAVRDAELKKALPEYTTQASDLEKATQLAKGGK